MIFDMYNRGETLYRPIARTDETANLLDHTDHSGSEEEVDAGSAGGVGGAGAGEGARGPALRGQSDGDRIRERYIAHILPTAADRP